MTFDEWMKERFDLLWDEFNLGSSNPMQLSFTEWCKHEYLTGCVADSVNETRLLT